MKKIVASVLALSIATFACDSHVHTPFVSEQELEDHVLVLTAEVMEGRSAGTDGARRASLYLKSELENCGAIPFFEGSDFSQTFAIRTHTYELDNNKMVIGNKEFQMETHFIPICSNAPTSFSGLVQIVKLDDTLSWNSIRNSIIALEAPSLHDVSQTFIDEIELKGAVGLLISSKASMPQKIICRQESPWIDAHIPIAVVNQEIWAMIQAFKTPYANGDLDVRCIKTHTENVVAKVVCKPQIGVPWVLLSSHYDHLGKFATGEGFGFYPGADDNASGVALALEVCEWACKNKNSVPYNLAVAFFSAEESGCLGSKHFVESLPNSTTVPSLILNVDMVGRLNNRQLFYSCRAPHSYLDTLVQNIGKDTSLNLVYVEAETILSDFRPFQDIGLPFLTFTTGTHVDYHKQTDVSSQINYGGLADITNLLISTIQQLSLPQANN